ncbi:MAG TPA: sensor histidine kinase [Streptomyces sp.]|nr:sensor histidine kinase [Streptomyces sp.]
MTVTDPGHEAPAAPVARRQLPAHIRHFGRSVPQCLVRLGAGLLSLITLPVLIGSAATCLVGIGFLLVPWEVRVLGRAADWERARLARLYGLPSPATPPRPRNDGTGLLSLLADARTWRDLRWTAAMSVAGTVLGLVAVPLMLLPVLGAAATGLWWLFPAGEPVRVLANIPVDSWTAAATLGVAQTLLGAALAVVGVPLLARTASALSRLLLEGGGKRQLAERVEDLSRTRSGAVDAHGSDLRRIERDLHDGTQAQLVALAIRLGLAERALEKDPKAAQALLGQAREGAEEAMTELRSVLRTMYPPILADRGLDGALSAVAARSAVPVRLELELPDTPPLPVPVETAVYFVVTEALTNVTKHSGATSATVTVRRDGERLHAEVRDEGRGGVDEQAGSGVTGMRQRVEAVDGTFHVNSPLGGPTCVRVDIPCGS